MKNARNINSFFSLIRNLYLLIRIILNEGLIMPDIFTCKCQKCGHEWAPNKENPVCCPRCKSYNWDKLKGEKRT